MSARTRQESLEREHWTGPTSRYDIVKEGVIATVVVAILTVLLAAVFSSPDDPALTFKGWANTTPDDFYNVTVAELAGTSESATYGAPYNNGGDGQVLGPLMPQKWVGIHQPIDPANDFVITPLGTQQQPEDVASALTRWTSASADATSSGCCCVCSGVMTKSLAGSIGWWMPTHFCGMSGPRTWPSPPLLYGGPYVADSDVPASSATVTL